MKETHIHPFWRLPEKYTEWKIFTLLDYFIRFLTTALLDIVINSYYICLYFHFRKYFIRFSKYFILFKHILILIRRNHLSLMLHITYPNLFTPSQVNWWQSLSLSLYSGRQLRHVKYRIPMKSWKVLEKKDWWNCFSKNIRDKTSEVFIFANYSFLFWLYLTTSIIILKYMEKIK